MFYHVKELQFKARVSRPDVRFARLLLEQFGGGNGEKVFRSLLINEYGKAMAKTGTVGVADYVMKSILEMHEVQSQGFIDGTKNKEV